MAARTSTARKTTKKKTTARKKKTARKKTTGQALVGSELPKSLSAFSRQLKRDLGKIERQLESAGKDTRRSLARIMRDASHQLGVLEARGQRGWRSLSTKARREVERTVKRVKKAIQ